MTWENFCVELNTPTNKNKKKNIEEIIINNVN